MAFSDVGARWWRRVPQSLQRPLRLAVGATRRWIADGGAQLGAAIAFYTMFAVAPLLVIAIALAGYVFGADAARGQIVGEIEGLVGETSARAIQTMIESAGREESGGRWAGLLGVATLLVGASGVFAQLRRAVWAGAITSALLFAVGKHAIGLYLGRASVSSSYGAAGSFVVFMLWVYYSAQILLFGAALSAEVDERSEAHTSPARDASIRSR